jgi:hypothetical protein
MNLINKVKSTNKLFAIQCFIFLWKGNKVAKVGTKILTKMLYYKNTYVGTYCFKTICNSQSKQHGYNIIANLIQCHENMMLCL